MVVTEKTPIKGAGAGGSVSSNSAWLVAVNIFVSLVQLVTVRFLYRWLGESAYAIYVLVIAYVGYANLFSPSVLYGVQKRLVERFHEGDLESALRIQKAQATIVLVTTVVGTLVLLGMGLFYNIPGANISRSSTFVLFAAGAIVFISAQINQMLVPILAALELFRSLAMRTACEKVAGAVVGIVLAYQYKSPLAVLAGTAGGSLVSVFINILSLRKSGQPYEVLPGKHPEEIKDLTKFAKLGYPHRILIGVSNSADRILYSYSGRPIDEISRYAIAYRAPEMIQMMFVFAADAVVPRLTRELTDDPKAAGKSLDMAGRLMLAIGTTFVMVPCAFGLGLLKVWLGEIPPAAPAAMAFLGTYFTLQMYIATMSKAFYASGRLHKAAVFTGYNAALTVILTIPAARWGGIVGVGAMNALIALTQFVPYAFWIRNDCMPDFDAARHSRYTVAIVAVGALFAVSGYSITAFTVVRDHPVLAILLAMIWAAATGAAILLLRLADVPAGFTAAIGRKLGLKKK